MVVKLMFRYHIVVKHGFDTFANNTILENQLKMTRNALTYFYAYFYWAQQCNQNIGKLSHLDAIKSSKTRTT